MRDYFSTTAVLATSILLVFLGCSEALQCQGSGWNLAGEKCVKLVKTPLSYQEAQDVCSQEFLEGDIMLPRVIELGSEEEQAILENYIRKDPFAPGFWLGARRIANTSDFIWTDSRSLEFSNWAPSHPTDDEGRECVELMSDAGKGHDTKSVIGLWKDVGCSKGNWVFCEKIPPMTMLEIVLSLRLLNRKLQQLNTTTLENLEQLDTEHKIRLVDLETTLGSNWTDVSSQIDALSERVDIVDTEHTAKLRSLETMVIDTEDSLRSNWTDLTSQIEVIYERIDNVDSEHNEKLASLNTRTADTENSLRTNWTHISSSISALEEDIQDIDTTHSNKIAGLETRTTNTENYLRANWTDISEDISTLAGLISSVNSSHITRLSNVENRATQIETSFRLNYTAFSDDISTVNNRINSVDSAHISRLNSVETKATQIENSVRSNLTEINRDISSLETKVNGIDTNLGKTIPVGFIFFQLPDQSTPASIWPQYQWTEVSSKYPGRFFRVVGGDARPFGMTYPQDDAFQGHSHSYSRTTANSGVSDNANDRTVVLSVSHTTTTSGLPISNGYGTPRIEYETRPINYSMRVWKRTA